MYLIGSRNIGVHNEHSDYDYATIDEDRNGGVKDVYNEKIDKRKHCYHYPKDYRERLAKWEYEDGDWNWLYNIEEYKSGLITINPFEYMDKWIAAIKNLDLFSSPFWNIRIHKPKKRIYHLIYNIEVIKNKSIDLPNEAIERIKRWKYGDVTLKDYDVLKGEIMAL